MFLRLTVDDFDLSDSCVMSLKQGIEKGTIV